MSNVREAGLTAEDIGTQYLNKKSELTTFRTLVAGEKILLGTSYDRGFGAINNARHEDDLRAGTRVLEDFHRQAETLNAFADRSLIYPSVPDILLTQAGEEALKDAKLQPYVMPGLHLSPLELDEINKDFPPAYRKLFPNKYLKGVASGQYPALDTKPYVFLAPASLEGKNSKIAEGAGIEDVAHTTILDVRKALFANGAHALDMAGLDSTVFSAKALSAPEVAVVKALHPEGKADTSKVVTNTRVHSSLDFVVFDSYAISQQNGNRNGVSPSVGAVGRELHPNVYVLPRRKLAKAS